MKVNYPISRLNQIAYKNSNSNNHARKGISVITPTNRPQFIENILANFSRQTYTPRELIIILNHNSMDLREWRERTRQFPNIKVLQLDESVSHGECLNFAVEQAQYEYIARFDDDDYYATNYLQTQIEALIHNNASIGGKSSWFIYFENSKTLAIYNPNHENTYETYLTGGSLIIKRDVFEQVRFRDVNVGEDLYFLHDCINQGLLIYSANRFDFVAIRRKDLATHTWKETEEQILRRCQFVAHTNDYIALCSSSAGRRNHKVGYRIDLRSVSRS